MEKNGQEVRNVQLLSLQTMKILVVALGEGSRQQRGAGSVKAAAREENL